jgi:hypothetical protein
MAGLADAFRPQWPPRPQSQPKLNWPVPDNNAVGRVYEPWQIEVLKDLLKFPYRVFPEGPGVPYSPPPPDAGRPPMPLWWGAP